MMTRRAVAALLFALLPILVRAAGPTGPGLGEWKVSGWQLHLWGTRATLEWNKSAGPPLFHRSARPCVFPAVPRRLCALCSAQMCGWCRSRTR